MFSLASLDCSFSLSENLRAYTIRKRVSWLHTKIHISLRIWQLVVFFFCCFFIVIFPPKKYNIKLPGECLCVNICYATASKFHKGKLHRFDIARPPLLADQTTYNDWWIDVFTSCQKRAFQQLKNSQILHNLARCSRQHICSNLIYNMLQCCSGAVVQWQFFNKKQRKTPTTDTTVFFFTFRFDAAQKSNSNSFNKRKCARCVNCGSYKSEHYEKLHNNLPACLTLWSCCQLESSFHGKKNLKYFLMQIVLPSDDKLLSMGATWVVWWGGENYEKKYSFFCVFCFRLPSSQLSR